MDRRGDLAFALALVVLGVSVVLAALSIRSGIYKDVVGPKAFPVALGLLIAAGGLYTAGGRVRQWSRRASHFDPDGGGEDSPDHPASGVRALAMIALCVGYAALFVPLGYLLSTPLFIVATLVLMGERRPLLLACLAIGFTLVFYVLFAQVLGARLPVGPLNPLFRELGLVNL